MKINLPKTFSDSLIRNLNYECERFRFDCPKDCEEIGWCEECWKKVIEMKRKGCGK